MKKRPLTNARVLVIGGSGFMGSNFIHHMLATYPQMQIVNLDLLTYAANQKNLDGVPAERYRFVKGDLNDTTLLMRLMKDVDFVVNFAAETHVDRSIHEDSGVFMQTNALGVHSLMRALAVSPKVALVVHISTDEVWGDLPLSSKKMFTEESAFRPSSPYAASKAAGDLLVQSYVRTYKLPVITTHSTNNFGPRQFPEKMIPFFIARSVGNTNIPLYGDGLYTRDWLYVDDHSRAVETLLAVGVVGESYAISQQGKEYSNKAMAERILKYLKKPKELISYVTDRPGHDRKYRVNSAKLRALGWKPQHSVEKALGKTIEWYLQNTNRLGVVAGADKVNSHIAS